MFLGILIFCVFLACKGSQDEDTQNQQTSESDRNPSAAGAQGRQGKDDGYLRYSSGSFLVADTFEGSNSLAALLSEMRDKKASISLSMLLSGGWSLEDTTESGEDDKIAIWTDTPDTLRPSFRITGCKAMPGGVGFHSVEFSSKDDGLKITFGDGDKDFMSDRMQKRMLAALGGGTYEPEDMHTLGRYSVPVAAVLDPQYCAPVTMSNYDETHNRSPSAGCQPEGKILTSLDDRDQMCFRYIYASQHAGYSVADDLPDEATVTPSKDPDFQEPKLEIFLTSPKLLRVATLTGGGLKYFLSAYDRGLAGTIKSSADKQGFRDALQALLRAIEDDKEVLLRKVVAPEGGGAIEATTKPIRR